MTDTGHKPGPFGGMSASEAGKLGVQRRREKREAEAAAEFGPVVTDADTEAIIRKARDLAKEGNLGAMRELREWVEIKKEDENRATDKRLLELLSPTTRNLITVELRLGELPEDFLQVIESELTERELVPPRWPYEATS
jgi:hypothetical protein